jgi:hypothetical protein
LDRLRAEAEKTGNYTKVLQYKRTKGQKWCNILNSGSNAAIFTGSLPL